MWLTTNGLFDHAFTSSEALWMDKCSFCSQHVFEMSMKNPIFEKKTLNPKKKSALAPWPFRCIHFTAVSNSRTWDHSVETLILLMDMIYAVRKNPSWSPHTTYNSLAGQSVLEVWDTQTPFGLCKSLGYSEYQRILSWLVLRQHLWNNTPAIYDSHTHETIHKTWCLTRYPKQHTTGQMVWLGHSPPFCQLAYGLRKNSCDGSARQITPETVTTMTRWVLGV